MLEKLLREQNRTRSSNKKLSPAQREWLLWDASRNYMRGRISDKDLENIERSLSSKSALLPQQENQAKCD